MSTGWFSIYLVLIGIGEKREQIWCKMSGKREQKAQREREVEVSEFPLSAHEYFSAFVNSSKKEVQGCVLNTVCSAIVVQFVVSWRRRQSVFVVPSMSLL